MYCRWFVRSPLLALPPGVPVPFRALPDLAPCPLALEPVAAGFPSPADDYVEARIDLNLELIPRPLSTFFMRVAGDAMAADGILDGDLLVIDRSLRARPGMLVVASHDGAFVLRRLERRAGRLWLVAGSEGWPPLALDPEGGDPELWGVAIHAVHHLSLSPSRRR